MSKRSDVMFCFFGVCVFVAFFFFFVFLLYLVRNNQDWPVLLACLFDWPVLLARLFDWLLDLSISLLQTPPVWPFYLLTPLFKALEVVLEGFVWAHHHEVRYESDNP